MRAVDDAAVYLNALRAAQEVSGTPSQRGGIECHLVPLIGHLACFSR